MDKIGTAEVFEIVSPWRGTGGLQKNDKYLGNFNSFWKNLQLSYLHHR